MTDIREMVATKLQSDDRRSEDLRQLWQALGDAYARSGADGVSRELTRRWDSKHAQLQDAIEKLRRLF